MQVEPIFAQGCVNLPPLAPFNSDEAFHCRGCWYRPSSNWCLRKILSSTMLRSVHVAATVEVLFELDCCELCYLATGWTLVQGQAGDATAPNGGRSSWFGFPIFQVELNPAPPLHGGTRVSAQQVECVKVIWKVCVTAPRA